MSIQLLIIVQKNGLKEKLIILLINKKNVSSKKK